MRLARLAVASLCAAVLPACFAEVQVGRYGIEHTIADQARVDPADKIPDNAVGIGFAFGVQLDWDQFVRVAASYSNALRDLPLKTTLGGESQARTGELTVRADVSALKLGDRTRLRLTAAGSSGGRQFRYMAKDTKKQYVYEESDGYDLYGGLTLSHITKSENWQWLVSVGPTLSKWQTKASGDLSAMGVQGRVTFVAGPLLLQHLAVWTYKAFTGGHVVKSGLQFRDLMIPPDVAAQKLMAAAKLKDCTVTGSASEFTARCKKSSLLIRPKGMTGSLQYSRLEYECDSLDPVDCREMLEELAETASKL